MRIRFKLRTILIGFTLLILLLGYYGMVYRNLTAEQVTLNRLKKAGVELNVNFKQVDNRSENEWSLKRFIDWPVRKFLGNVESRSRCVSLQLKVDGYHSDGEEAGKAKIDLSCLANFEKLERIVFWCKVTPDEIRALRSLPNLWDIDLIETGADESYVDSLLEIESLTSVSFDQNKLSMASFDRLTEAGINVCHYGLNDFVLTENFIRHSGNFYPVAIEKTELICTVIKDAQGSCCVSYHAYVPAMKHRYSSKSPIPTFESCHFLFDGNWRSLDGYSAEFAFPPWTYEGNYYDGIHNETNDFKVKIELVRGSRFRTRWNFTSSETRDCVADAELPLLEIGFRNRDKFTPEEAHAIMKESFELSDFDEPIINSKAWHSIRYPLKSDLHERE